MPETSRPDLRAILAENPGVVVESAAAEHGVSCRDIVEALPEAYRRFAPGAFVEAMGDIAGWGEVTTIIHTADGIFEITGPVPAGQVAQGYYNLMSRTGLHGHLRFERCAAIAFLERPFMKRSSAAVLFFNQEGGIMLKVFVGRDENGDLKPDQLTAFHALAEKLQTAAAPAA
jgi:putative heme utilization carrier protein HutX